MKNQEYDRLLSPTPLEFAALMVEIFGQFLHRVATFNVTNFILTSLGHGFDPDGSRLPEWKINEVPVADSVEIKDGGFPVAYVGEWIRSEATTGAQAKAEKAVDEQKEITRDEWIAMQAHNPPLLNVNLALKLKRYWMEGRTDKQAAALAGCSKSYARHHRLVFQKTTHNPSPTDR